MDQLTLLRLPWILPFASSQASLQAVGGKGANLSRLAHAGFPVPSGFLVTTQAYRDFVQENKLEERILGLLPEVGSETPETLEHASQQIRALFSAGKINAALVSDLEMAYRQLGEVAVAVRSSATAEDLPEMSFAGQQDTYLNIQGCEPLLRAVVDCWSSLWTARAIGYRARNSVPHAGAALAIVVQKMLESQASGVLFTANPLTGLRSETVIDATIGLGEALVSGLVEPDHYVVDTTGGRILSKMLGAKALTIHGKVGGGTHVQEQDCRDTQALPDEQILALAQLGQRVAALYDFPQDIEWAWAEGKLSLLQSRPVTSLFPVPDGMPSEPLKVMFSFAAVQGLFDPVTPLGRDTLRQLFAAGASLFGVRVTGETQTALYEAGERLWINFTPILRNSIGRRLVPFVFGLVEPTVHQAILQIWDDPRLKPGRSRISFQAIVRIARFALPLGFNIWLNLLAPRRRREYIVQNGERLLELLETRLAAITGDRREKLALQVNLMTDFVARYIPSTLRLFVSGVAAGMASWNFLNLLAVSAGRGEFHQAGIDVHDLVLQVTRGMPYNPTTEMDLTLWEMARLVGSDAPSMQVFQSSTASELAEYYHSRELPQVAWQAVHKFLDKYGGRGLGEIDLGRRRWAQDPTHVFEMLMSFLQIEDEAIAPDAVFARGAGMAQEAIAELAVAVRNTPRGWLKARLVRFFAGRARQLMGARESPKFFAVRMLWVFHRELLKTGQEFVQAGELESPDDLFYLSFSELKALSTRQKIDWRSLVAARREASRRERLRRQIPRLLLSDGRAFYEGMHTGDCASEVGDNSITGSPVSPGNVQGRVRVVLDPRQAGLVPGEIMVCPGTDPSWTPLFLSAAGLVMETGGMMTHGAVVAREYGIPAIVGVDKATLRLQTGQLISINGSSGQILVLEDQP